MDTIASSYYNNLTVTSYSTRSSTHLDDAVHGLSLRSLSDLQIQCVDVRQIPLPPKQCVYTSSGVTPFNRTSEEGGEARKRGTKAIHHAHGLGQGTACEGKGSIREPEGHDGELQ